MTNRIIQAYRQAPWRVQLQWIGLFSLGLVLVASVAAVYLSISTRTAVFGREIQQIDSDIEEMERNIANFNNQLAMLTSSAQMQKRAADLGFVSVEPGIALFLEIPGYTGREPAIIAPPPSPSITQGPLIVPDYTQSLWDWLFRSFLLAKNNLGQVQQ
jgi:hypothetical protein